MYISYNYKQGRNFYPSLNEIKYWYSSIKNLWSGSEDSYFCFSPRIRSNDGHGNVYMGKRFQEYVICIKENYLSLPLCLSSCSIHGFGSGSGPFFFCPDWLAYSLNLYIITQSKSNWQKKKCAVRSGFSTILNSLESHSFFLWTLSLVTQTNLILYHISSIKSIQSGLAEIL